VIEVDKGIGGPKDATEFFAPDEFAGMMDKMNKDTKRLLAEPDARATPSQLSVPGIDLVDAKAPDSVEIFEGFQV
jgi:hypothetical protein